MPGPGGGMPPFPVQEGEGGDANLAGSLNLTLAAVQPALE